MVSPRARAARARAFAGRARQGACSGRVCRQRRMMRRRVRRSSCRRRRSASTSGPTLCRASRRASGCAACWRASRQDAQGVELVGGHVETRLMMRARCGGSSTALPRFESWQFAPRRSPPTARMRGAYAPSGCARRSTRGRVPRDAAARAGRWRAAQRGLKRGLGRCLVGRRARRDGGARATPSCDDARGRQHVGRTSRRRRRCAAARAHAQQGALRAGTAGSPTSRCSTRSARASPTSSTASLRGWRRQQRWRRPS